MTESAEPTKTPEVAAPEAEDGTSARDQTAVGGNRLPVPVPDRRGEGLRASSLDGALDDLADDPRNYGRVPLLRVVAAWARDRHNLHEQLSNCRAENAGLKGEQQERQRHRPLVVLAIAVGPLLVVIGVDFATKGHVGGGAAIVLTGLALTALGIYLSEFFRGKGPR